MEVSNEFLQLQQIKFNLFLSQDPDNGQFNVNFEIGGKLLYAHKTMLNLVSPTFSSMLSDRWSKKNEPIKIKDYSYDDFYFYQFLTFLYSAQCELSETNIYALVDMAEFYGVDLFRTYCRRYLSIINITVENVFPLMNLANKYDINQLAESIKNFVGNNFTSVIKSNEFINVDKNVVLINTKLLLKMYLTLQVFKWCEKQAMKKQSADASLNLNDVIKVEIANFLPEFCFQRMKLKFIAESVASRGFIFPSYDVFSKILSDRFSQPLVRVTNGQTLHGNLIPDRSVISYVKSVNLTDYDTCDYRYCWWDTKCKRPSTLSPLQKKDGIEWYLIYYRSGNIGVKWGSDIVENVHYLLAELTAGASGFDTAKDCKIEFE